MFRGLLCFIYRAVHSLEGLSLTRSKSLSDNLLVKPSMASLLTGVSSPQVIEEEYVFIKSQLNRA